MNRRRIFSGIHRAIARHESAGVAPADHSTIERMSMRDLDKIGPRLIASTPAPLRCAYCGASCQSDAHDPFCSTTCAVNAENS